MTGAHPRALVALKGGTTADRMHADAAAGGGGVEGGGAGVHCACRVATFEADDGVWLAAGGEG